MICHKTDLSKFKIEIIPNITYEHNGIKLEIDNEKNLRIHKDVEIKLHTPEQSMDQIRNHKRNKCLETNKHGNATYLCDRAKAVLRGKFIVINTYFKKRNLK